MHANFKLTKQFFPDIKEEPFFPLAKIDKNSIFYGYTSTLTAQEEKVLLALDMGDKVKEEFLKSARDKNGFWVYVIKQGLSLKPGSVGVNKEGSNRTLSDRLYEHSVTNNNSNSPMFLLMLERFDTKKAMVDEEKRLKKLFGTPYLNKNESFPITKDSKEAADYILQVIMGKIESVQDHRRKK